MQGSRSVALALVLVLRLLVGAQTLLVVPVSDRLKGLDASKPPAPSKITTSTSSILSSESSASTSTSSSSSSSFTSSTPLNFSSTSTSFSTETIAISSLMGHVPSISATPSTSMALAASYTGIALSTNLTAAHSPPATKHSSDGHRTLIIILSSVLGFLGLLLIVGAIFLVYRFSQGRNPFGQGRGVSPILDDEIASWRGTVIEQKQKPRQLDPAILNLKSDSIALSHSPGWTWTASPTSVRSALSPSTTIPDTPLFLAKAPNSRAGLTDETVPGADPFIPPMKRQSSRLSKAPKGHGRSKSRRSSTSAKSVWSFSGGVGPYAESKTTDKMPMWFDPEDSSMGKEFNKTGYSNNSPPTPVFDVTSLGGLSPRPKSQPRPWESEDDIGRAIA